PNVRLVCLQCHGLLPRDAGSPTYIFGSPLFDRVTIELLNGNKFVIESADNGQNQDYIQSAELNGKLIDRAWLHHREIADGGILRLQMSSRPNQNWAASTEAIPPASTTEDFKEETNARF